MTFLSLPRERGFFDDFFTETLREGGFGFATVRVRLVRLGRGDTLGSSSVAG